MDKLEVMPNEYRAVLPRKRGHVNGEFPSPHSSRTTKGELILLLHMATALMSADDVDAALHAIARNLTELRPDAVLLISAGDGGGACYYLETPQGSTCLELEHRLCKRMRKLVEGDVRSAPLHAFTLDNGTHVVAPFSADADSGYIALGWHEPPEPAVQRRAIKLLPCIAELAGIRLSSLLEQLHREEAAQEQNQAHAESQSRHKEELRASEREKAAARHLAAQDELTGLQNRRGFLAKSEQCLLIARRQQLACAVIFADLDGLKQVNDQLGHAAGDELIRDAARIFSSAFRHADVVGRVGGDEFAAFTFDNATPGAIIERIQDKIAKFNETSAGRFAMSLSIGVINCDVRSEEALSEYLLRADEEMYRDKRHSRSVAH